MKGANKEVLITDGFWIVQDNRKSGSISTRHANLSRLLERSEDCRMKFETSHFGTSLSAANALSYARGPVSNLHDFIVKSMALEMAIDDVMMAFIGGGGEINVFREALYYNISSNFEILYDQDVDLDRHFDTAKLQFRGGQSLIDRRASHLEVTCKDDYEEEVVEVYQFSNADMCHIWKGNCKVAHNIPLVDDGFGLCAKAWVMDGERPKDACLRVIHGVTRGAIIASMFGTRTSVHVEDSLLATFNLMVLGAPKIWYIVPNRNGDRFKHFLMSKGLLEATFEKRCFIQAFADGHLTLSKSEMESYEVRRIVQ